MKQARLRIKLWLASAVLRPGEQSGRVKGGENENSTG